MKKNKKLLTGILIYTGAIAVLCIIVKEYWIAAAVLGIIALAGYLRTRHLVTEYDGENERKDK